jgi:hypothetical protein
VLLVWRDTYLTARSVIAVEVVSLLLIAALIMVIFVRLGTETLRATNPAPCVVTLPRETDWRRSVRVHSRHLVGGF